MAPLMSVFRSLKKIDLTFRLAMDTAIEATYSSHNHHYRALSKGGLRDALESRDVLASLAIKFDEFGHWGPMTDMKYVLGDKAWPKLRHLDLECMSTDDDYMVSALQRQKSLNALYIGNVRLSSGVWEDVITTMRKELDLTTFYPSGVLEDDDTIHCTEQLDVTAYEDGCEISLSMALDMYVTDDPDDGLAMLNPLIDGIFDDPEIVKAEFGHLSDSESFDSSSHMECD